MFLSSPTVSYWFCCWVAGLQRCLSLGLVLELLQQWLGANQSEIMCLENATNNEPTVNTLTNNAPTDNIPTEIRARLGPL
jgi:hypothetical protein